MKEFITNGQDETIALGQKIGARLKANDVLAISGELGAGKTTFIKGLAEGLGVKEFVSSPSFIIVNEYSGGFPFYHMDLYRLSEGAEIMELGIEEYFQKGAVVAVEWAERLGDFLPRKRISIHIEPVSEMKRKIKIEEIGTKRLEGLK